MGSGTFDSLAYVSRTNSLHTKSRQEIFVEKNINNAMDPFGLAMRESRDSTEHPESLAIILALDVTGSMGSIPHYLVQEGLPHIVDKIIKKGILHPQILFLGIGDHVCDKSPLQVGQFESSDELLQTWLTKVFLEGGGGANDGESYHLAWYFASKHTSIDCFEKRNQKGYLFTIGDEPTLPTLQVPSLKTIMGHTGVLKDYTANELYDEVCKKYHTYHIHIKQTRSGARKHVIDGWHQLLWDNLLVVDSHTEIADLIASKINLDTTTTSLKEEITTDVKKDMTIEEML